MFLSITVEVGKVINYSHISFVRNNNSESKRKFFAFFINVTQPDMIYMLLLHLTF